MDRRIFLKSSGLALVSYGVLPRFLVRAAYAEGEAARRRKALVVVFQRGACDGLNTVIPYGEGPYRSLRPFAAPPPAFLITGPEGVSIAFTVSVRRGPTAAGWAKKFNSRTRSAAVPWAPPQGEPRSRQ